MALDIYSSLLEELGQILEIPLKPDPQNTCLIRFPDDMEIQIEPDGGGGGDQLIIGATIGVLPPGKYREDFLESALKTNFLEDPRCGAFGFTQKNERLVLFHLMPLSEIKGVHVAEFLIPFIEKLKKWRDSLKNDEVPQILSDKATSGGGIFGLTP